MFNQTISKITYKMSEFRCFLNMKLTIIQSLLIIPFLWYRQIRLKVTFSRAFSNFFVPFMKLTCTFSSVFFKINCLGVFFISHIDKKKNVKEAYSYNSKCWIKMLLFQPKIQWLFLYDLVSICIGKLCIKWYVKSKYHYYISLHPEYIKIKLSTAKPYACGVSDLLNRMFTEIT